MSQHKDDTTEHDEPSGEECERPPGSYYYDDATGYEIYDPEKDDEEDEDEKGEFVNHMISATQIKDLREAAPDFEKTKLLKEKLAKLRQERQPLFLTAEEFDEILEWKLLTQYGRQQAHRSQNTDEIIRAVTSLALNITHEDEDYELELRISILSSLRGVAVPVASAVLTLIYPEKYGVIDFRNWRQIFGERKNAFSLGDYKRYMKEIRRLAKELSWSIQEVDHAIWEYDRRHGSDF